MYVSRYATFNAVEEDVATIKDIVTQLEQVASAHHVEGGKCAEGREGITQASGDGDGGLERLLLGNNPMSGLATELEVSEYIRLQASMAATLLALATTSMRLRGLQIEGHPLEKETIRMKETLEKIEALTEAKSEADAPRSTVNIEAAKRIVRHHTKRRKHKEVIEID